MLNKSEHIKRLIDHIHGTHPLNGFEEAEMAKIVTVKALKKKEILIKPGDYSNNMNFISTGCLRAFYIDKSGQEHTLQLGIENWWVNDLFSYIKNVPSKMYVQAMEDTVIVQIPKNELERLYKEVPVFSNFFREKIQSAYVALQERTIENMSRDAIEKYLAFRKQYRDIEQRIPQYIIASYLGITPEFLSFLRKKHAKDLS